MQFHGAESGGDFCFEIFGVSICGSYDGCLKHGIKCDSRSLSVSFYEAELRRGKGGVFAYGWMGYTDKTSPETVSRGAFVLQNEEDFMRGI